MATQNQDPQNVYNYEVNFTTTNLSNGDEFIEPHTVSDPNGSFSVPLNFTKPTGNAYGSIIVIPMSSNSSNGAYYLKLHLPQPGESKMYVTFAQKNNSMADGYYDYIQGIPEDFRTQLRLWILDGLNQLPVNGISKSKTLVFTVKGIDTNVSSASVQFTVSFGATFGGKGDNILSDGKTK